MNSRQELLTIAIPTYNRSPFLRRLLQCLTAQLKDELRVELIISDNASTDDTQEVIASFRREGLRFTAHRNDVNIGGDANIHRCFELASCKYAWIIGDDDLVRPGGVAKVLSFITAADYDIIYMKSESYDQEYVPDFSTKFPVPKTYTDSVAFARDVNVWFTFISGNVVNKERALSLSSRPFSDYLGTTIIQLSWVFTLLSNFKRGLYVTEPLVAAKADNTGNYSACKVFGVTLKDVSEALLQDRRMSGMIVNSSIKHMLPRILMTLRFKDHKFHDEDPESILKPSLGRNFLYWIFCYPLMHLPEPFAWAWYYGIRVSIRLERLLSR